MWWWFVYGLGCALTWYENYYVVRERGERPYWYASPKNQSFFWFTRLVVVYGSLLGLLWSFGLLWALAALAAYFALSKLTFRRYFVAAVATEYMRVRQSFEEDPKGWSLPQEGADLTAKAYEVATRNIIDNMQND